MKREREQIRRKWIEDWLIMKSSPDHEHMSVVLIYTLAHLGYQHVYQQTFGQVNARCEVSGGRTKVFAAKADNRSHQSTSLISSQSDELMICLHGSDGAVDVSGRKVHAVWELQLQTQLALCFKIWRGNHGLHIGACECFYQTTCT